MLTESEYKRLKKNFSKEIRLAKMDLHKAQVYLLPLETMLEMERRLELLKQRRSNLIEGYRKMQIEERNLQRATLLEKVSESYLSQSFWVDPKKIRVFSVPFLKQSSETLETSLTPVEKSVTTPVEKPSGKASEKTTYLFGG